VEELRGKTAAITGAGSGIGRALALTFAREGMDVAIGDIERDPAEAVAAEVRAAGVAARADVVDVASRDSVGEWARAVAAEFGGVHLLCNNAGVVVFRRAQDMKESDWTWVIGVDLLGVIHGVEAFLPAMLARGQGGHIVNTASIAGLFANAAPGLIAYNTAKYGVVGLSETLRADLADAGIGVSVLCPGGVRTRIGEATRNRPASLGGPEPIPEVLRGGIQVGMDPMDVAALVLRAVKEDQLYVLTHPESRADVEARFRAILAGYDWAGKTK
jgi:NAD(P)-dependent dehydrogenase (short-subunit alcohol dehydrogenase family)